MEQVDAMMLSDTTETNSTSNSSFINEVNDHISLAQASHLARNTSLDLTPDANYTNCKKTNNHTNKDRYWSRPSITPSEDDINKRRPSKQDKEVCSEIPSSERLTFQIIFMLRISFTGYGPRIVNVS